MELNKIDDFINKNSTNGEYDFLKNQLPGDLILLGYGGSIAYGTDTENSDIDLSGIYYNDTESLIGRKKREDKFTHDRTDSVLFSLNLFVEHLLKATPSAYELVGNRVCDYIYMSEYGRKLVENRKQFLSKRCVKSFINYSTSQFDSARGWEHFQSTDKIQKLINKKLMHSVRALYMLIDILLYGDITTYRGNNIDTLLDIRNGKYLDIRELSDGTNICLISEEYQVFRKELLEHINKLVQYCCLPDDPNFDFANKLVYDANYDYVSHVITKNG